MVAVPSSMERLSAAETEINAGLKNIQCGDFSAALTKSTSAANFAQNDEEQFQACLLRGKACFCSGDHEGALDAYQQAAQLKEAALESLEGIAEVQAAQGEHAKAVETYRKLLRLAVGDMPGEIAKLAKTREFLWRLAKEYEAMGDLTRAEAQLQELLRMRLASHSQRLEALCFLADIQITIEDGIMQKEIHERYKMEQDKPRHLSRSLSVVQRTVDASRADAMEAEGGLAETLKQIVNSTMPSPRYVKYHERHLQRHLSLLGAYPPRSAARQEKRLAALRTCKRMIETTTGGCCTPYPFEAAIWLWEETEELYGAQVPSVSRSTSARSMSGDVTAQAHAGMFGSRQNSMASQGGSGVLSTSPRGYLHGGSRESSRAGSRASSRVTSPREWHPPAHSSTHGGLHQALQLSTSPRAANIMSTSPRAGMTSPRRRSLDQGNIMASPKGSSLDFGRLSPILAISEGEEQRAQQEEPRIPEHTTDLSFPNSRRSVSFNGDQARRQELRSASPHASPKRSSLDNGRLTPIAAAAAAEEQRAQQQQQQPVENITDLSVPGSRRSVSFTGGESTRQALRSGALSGDERGASPFLQMMDNGAMASPFGAPPPPDVVAAAGPSSPRGLGSHRRSSSYGSGFVMPLDRADSIRNVCVNTFVGNDLVTSKVEACGLELAHQFPWAASSYVAIGLALRRRLLSDPASPSTAPKRRQIIRCLRTGVDRGADSAAGWMAYVELLYQERKYLAAYEAGVAGLAWSVRRRERGHETLTQFALPMRLLVARALRRLGRLEEAEYAFKVLAGWVSEGDGAFSELSGSPTPRNIHQEALRGIAKVLLERGNRAKAKWQYEKILGKALLGRGREDHWAHSEYAWIAFEDGDLPTAKQHLLLALEAAAAVGSSVTEWEVAEHHYKLGRVLWRLGDGDRQEARQHFAEGAACEGHAQAASLAWLGKWEQEEGQNLDAARDAYQLALDIDRDQPDAVEGIARLTDMGRAGSFADWAAKSGGSSGKDTSFPGFGTTRSSDRASSPKIDPAG